MLSLARMPRKSEEVEDEVTVGDLIDVKPGEEREKPGDGVTDSQLVSLGDLLSNVESSSDSSD